MAHGLSKSRLMSFRQCPKKLWLEKRCPDLGEVTAEQQAIFDMGHDVGAIAQQLYDTGGGVLIEYDEGLRGAVERTNEVLRKQPPVPIFEATFVRNGLLIRADVLERGPGGPRLIEVKSSTRVKDEHIADCAIQSWVLDTSTARPTAVVLAHINNQFVYAGDGRYKGLLTEADLTAQVAPLRGEVAGWLREAKRVLAGAEPKAEIGRRCTQPYDCQFQDYCWKKTEFPLRGLPNINSRLDELLAAGYQDVREVPEAMLKGPEQLRVWRAVRSGEVSFSPAARDEFAGLAYPRYYLDFETVGSAVPRWAGMRPYQPVPFQFSLHVESAPGQLQHAEYLDLTGELPARAVAVALLEAAGSEGPVFMYTSYEKQCLEALAKFCPDLRERLEALMERLVDLHPIAKRNYYHPAMQGSWSIKNLLPAIAPELDYSHLGEIQEGNAAGRAYLEAIAPETTAGRRAAIRESLIAYCKHDTLAMVTVARYLEGR